MDKSRINENVSRSSSSRSKFLRKRHIDEIHTPNTLPESVREHIKFGENGQAQSVKHTELGKDGQAQFIEHMELDNGKVQSIKRTELKQDGKVQSIEHSEFGRDGKFQSIQTQDIQLSEDGKPQHIKFKDLDLNDKEGTRFHEGYKLQRELEKMDVIKKGIIEHPDAKRKLMQHPEIKEMF